MDTGVLRPFPVRAVVDCCPANGRCNLFSVPCGPSSRSGAQCRRITSLTGGPSLDTEGHGSCVLTLKRWLHFVPLCVSLIGGPFLPGPHVDLLFWCVVAGRLGGCRSVRWGRVERRRRSLDEPWLDVVASVLIRGPGTVVPASAGSARS